MDNSKVVFTWDEVGAMLVKALEYGKSPEECRKFWLRNGDFIPENIMHDTLDQRDC